MSCHKQISALLQNCIALLLQFESQLAETTISPESIVNVLLVLAIETIFVEYPAKDKRGLISNQCIENLRVASMGVLRQVIHCNLD